MLQSNFYKKKFDLKTFFIIQRKMTPQKEFADLFERMYECMNYVIKIIGEIPFHMQGAGKFI